MATTMKVSDVTTKMSVTDQEVNGFKVSAEVEIYNETKEIKSISARVRKIDTSNNTQETWYYNVTRSMNDNMMPSPGNSQTTDPVKKNEAFSAGIEFEKAIIEMVKSTNVESIIKE